MYVKTGVLFGSIMWPVFWSHNLQGYLGFVLYGILGFFAFLLHSLYFQARIVALNASYFLKAGGHFVISIKVCSLADFFSAHSCGCFTNNLLAFYYQFAFEFQANCIDSTAPAEAVFQQEVKKLQAERFKPFEQITLEPFERDHACVIGGYRMPKKQKAAA